MIHEHQHHPGHDADDCPLRITVTAQSRSTHDGYACSLTGGHCLPEEVKCQQRVERAEELATLHRSLEQGLDDETDD